jgi:signal transduction histidine kinase/ligand-binding sensor domain-containing protein
MPSCFPAGFSGIRNVLLAFLVAGCWNHVDAAAQTLRGLSHSSWTERDGAPHGIHALAQTSDGYLWLGTSAGLFRFDGMRFTAFNPPPESPQFNSLDVYVLTADSENGLWIGFRVGGISCLKNGRLTNYDERNGLPAETVDQVWTQQNGAVWAVSGGRLMTLVGARWEDVRSRLGLGDARVERLFLDRSANLWIAADHHVYLRRRGEERATSTPDEIRAGTQFEQAPDGAVWIADGWTNVRPLTYSHESSAKLRIKGSANILFDSDGYLWVANDYFAVDVVNPEALRDESAIRAEHFDRSLGLTSNECYGILQDREGNIWVGTGLGLDRFQRSTFTAFSDAFLRSFPALSPGPDGAVWIASWGQPLLRTKDGKTTSFGPKRGWGPSYCDRNEVVWAYDYWRGELWTLQHGEFARVEVPPILERAVVQSMTGDGRGGLFASFEHKGLWHFRNEQWDAVGTSGSTSPLCLMLDSSGRLWAGFADGTIAVLEQGSIRKVPVASLANLGSVMTLYEHADHIWGGGTNGLVAFTGAGFQPLQIQDSRGLHGISGIVEDRDGRLWLNAACGVVRLWSSEVERALREPTYRMRAEIFDFRDGISGAPAQLRPTPSAIVDSAERIWFATAGNVTSVDPSANRTPPSLPRIAIEAIRSAGKEYPVAGSGAIRIGARNLEIDYVGISLTAPQRVTYRYRLDSEDGDWREAGTRRQAFYTSLRPGRYRFRIAASVGDGRWNESELQSEIVVPPAFYQTAWFASICVLAIVTVLLIGHWIRLQQVTARVRDRLEERTAERVRIARDLHDTLLQGLQGLMLRFHFAAERIPEGAPARGMMEEALNVGDRVVEESRDSLRDLRCALSGRGLARALAEVGEELNWQRSIQFSVSIEGSQTPLPTSVEGELYFIGREAIANAFRHAGASQIQVQMSSDDSYLRLRCRDDGRGMDAAVLNGSGKEGHWGLLGMRERAQKLGAQFDCCSAPGKGTEIAVTVCLLRSKERSARLAASGAIYRLFGRRLFGRRPFA